MDTKLQSITPISFGEIKSRVEPKPEFRDHTQALDAMRVAVHSTLSAWVVDHTLDPDAKDGKQEEIKRTIKLDGKPIADLIVEVPTTSQYDKTMFGKFVDETLVPTAENAARSYTSTRAAKPDGQSRLTQSILPDALHQASQRTPRELQRR